MAKQKLADVLHLPAVKENFWLPFPVNCPACLLGRNLNGAALLSVRMAVSVRLLYL